ncbi:DNA repair protein RecO [Rhodohalobacter sp. 614A]|uniref:DNA repair protein RecO n=1 Tax=Rhodohalobacter sp. 614A TaxID=2908649 RepID=UPI001F45E9DF|nr:DNA repair protein RecO [Rhodohalobacter sp. 614A]
MVTKTESVVLRTIDYSESSQIVTLFTRKHGIIAVIAKGAKRPKSKFAALMVPGQVLEVVVYVKPTRSVQTLSEASAMLKLDQLRIDLEKMAIATTTLELINQVLHENEVNEPLFAFVVKFLSWVNEYEKTSRVIFPYVQLRVMELIGIGLQQDPSVDEETSAGYMNIESGTLSSKAEGDQSIRLTWQQFIFLKKSLHSKKESIFETDFKKSELSELIEYLDKYIRYHVEGVKPRKSDQIFEKILNN